MLRPGKFLSLYIEYCKLKISRGSQFRLDFLGGLTMGVFSSFLTPLFQFLIYHNTRGYPGWTFDEILLFQALLLIWYGISNTFFGEIRYQVQNIILLGQFDIYLLKPFHSLGLIFAQGFNYRSPGTLLAGSVLLIYCLVTQHIALTWAKLGIFIIMQCAGILFYISFLIFFICLSIKLLYVVRLIELMDKLLSVAYFPAEIFKGVIKIVYLVFLPMAIWAYYPAQLLLGRLSIYIFFSLITIVVIFFLALKTWDIVLKQYTSAGG